MNAKLDRSNLYPGKCDVCGVAVAAQRGYIIPRDAFGGPTPKHNRKWCTICRTVQCATTAVGQVAVEVANARELRADGSIVMPYDERALPLLRAIGTWDGDAKCWRASPLLRDRDLVLSIADKLGLAVDESLRTYEDPPHVRAAVERARAVPTIREYQVEGVRWLAYRGDTTGAPEGFVDKRPGALEADDPGLGKQQPVDTKVLTPQGWREIGSLRVGDSVIGSNGQATGVTGVFPQGVKPSYRVWFTDGSNVEAGPEHLWTVRYYSNGRDLADIVLTTEQLRTRVVPGRRDFSKVRLYLPLLTAPAVFDEPSMLSIGPYTLGTLIANGGLSHGSAQLTVGAVDQPEIAEFIAAEGTEIRKWRNPVPTVATGTVIGAVHAVRELGLAVLSRDKFIPEIYKRASVADRLALLHGLMDCDGSITPTRNRVYYHTTSERLARDVQELVECLGGVAQIRAYDRRHQNKPTDYQVRVRMPEDVAPFRIRRKLERFSPTVHVRPTRRIDRVEYVRDVESVCISVAAADHLYATEHAILTHNTVQVLLQLADDEALVVVCPANAKAVWQRETEKWRPGRFDVVTICEGTESFKWPDNPRELVVINYDVLPFTPAQIVEEREKIGAQLVELGEPTDGEDVKVTRKRKRLTNLRETNATRKPAGEPPCNVLLVIDEAHYVENNKALRTVRVRHLASKATRVIGLTGTPVESEPLKLWGLLTTLRCNPFTWVDRWPPPVGTFLHLFNASRGQWGGLEFARIEPRPGSTSSGPVKVEAGTTEILARCMLRRTKEQVLPELPAKVYSEIPVALPEKLIRELDEISAEHIDAILSGELPPFEAMSAIRKALAQACIPTMLEIVESYETAGIPLGVFSAHRGPVEALAERKDWYTITGDTSSKRRGEIQDAFQLGEGVGVAGTRAMAEAMTLTRASTVLFVDRFWERKHNEQAEDRFHRIGQHDSVNVITLVPDHPLTQHCAELLGAKYSFVDAVLHGEQEYAKPVGSRFDVVDDAEWKARVDAKVDAERKREAADKQREQARRERELAKIAEREVSPKVSEQRATLRAQRLQIDVARYAHIPVDIVRDALAYMLARCDGAVEKDDEGFNKPDGCVARWLAPGVVAGLPYAVASMAAILHHYPRQLTARFAPLFEDRKQSGE